MTSLFSLVTLNYFKTSYMILTKLGAFYLVSLACSHVCCQRTVLEIRILKFPRFIKLVVYNKKKLQMFLLKMSFISHMK